MDQDSLKPNFLAGAYIIRDAHLRQDLANKDLLHAGNTRFLPLMELQACLSEDQAPLLLDQNQGIALLDSALHCIFLGRYEDTNIFALDLDANQEATLKNLGADSFVGLRTAALKLRRHPASLLAYASAMIKWHRRTRYCGTCGNPTVAKKSGHVRHCEQCGTQHFPRLDPAIIVLVTDGERILLGRQPSWDSGRYSTIAGFVEPGESLEDAVEREVLEETDIVAGDVRYHSSQPWPFPASLMLGFFARAKSREIILRDDELEDAQWFTKRDIKQGELLLPFPVSISFRLIEDWFNSGESEDLRSVIQRNLG